jgi:hypothetical protein
VDDVLDIAELEQRLFPKPVGTWGPEDWLVFFATAQQLADRYGKDQIVAMVDELLLIGAGPTKEMADAIRFSVRP